MAPMKHLSLLVCGFCFLLLSTPGWTADAAKWELVWSDEFDATSGMPDPTKWDYETGFIRNNESQLYTRARKENARLEGGHLVIEGRKEHFKNPGFQPGKESRRNREWTDYTSASLVTKGKASWTYGRIEVRAQLPKGRGNWPAIWMLGTNMSAVGWPACGEIDIMEFVGHEPGIVHANAHTRKYNHANGTGKGDKIAVADASSQFHTYTLEWFPDRLDFYVDEKKYFSYSNEGSGTNAWPFDKPQYLILNLAIGGTWGGAKGIDETIWPQKFLIDYVRVYRAK